MSRSRSLVNSDYYSNALVLSREGKTLCTLNRKRVNWYLKKKLATEIPPPDGYPRCIQLNFKANVERDPQIYEIAIIENKCVICGGQDNLTLHHVVPHVIRKLFPVAEKGRARQWCVLLCIDCHEKVETQTQPLYKVDYPNGVRVDQEKSAYTLRYLKSINMLNRLNAAKYVRLMTDAGYKTEADIPPPPSKAEKYSLHNIQSKMHQKAITAWGHKFIETHGGIQGTKAYFRELFLSCKPTYIPEGYLDL
jgi:5-methylcytosine-specific restriction endonuclease McrA